jgi:hypothetical protein
MATEDMLPTERELLEAWTQAHRQGGPVVGGTGSAESAATGPTSTEEGPIVPRTERGLRICPGCGRPLHLAAVVCRHCGASAPK